MKSGALSRPVAGGRSCQAVEGKILGNKECMMYVMNEQGSAKCKGAELMLMVVMEEGCKWFEYTAEKGRR